MMTTRLRTRLGRAGERWGRFWFEPQSTATLAVVRILFGLVALEWSISLLPDLRTFFSSGGVLPRQPVLNVPGVWAPLSLSSSFGIELVVYIAIVAAALCLILGVGTRLASAIVWLGLLAFTRRNPYVFNSGDAYLRVVAFYLALTPAGAALSIRQWLRHRSEFWVFPQRSLWGLRLLQVQVSIVYLSAFWDKLRAGPLWNDGTAISYVLRIGDVTRFPTPVLHTNSVAINLMTFGTLAVELAVGVLIWNKRLRPWVLAIAITFHLIIDYSIRVGSFSFVAIVALIAFVSPEASARAINAIRARRLVGSGHLRGEVIMSGIPERAPTVGSERH
jgi:Vitamin K-dependent gamma-carboxylase